jgi:hypothetical protein
MMKRPRIYRYFLWLTIVVILTGMTSCGPKEIELTFETIERSDLGSYSIREPCLILITAPQEIDQVEGLITQEALDRLAELDFGQYFAIAVFRGRQATSGYDTMIERVARRGDKIVVYAQFWGPSPHYGVQNEATSPYHLIKVRRDDGVDQETELVLQSRAVTPTPPSR